MVPGPPHTAPDWLDDLPLKAGPPWLSMGLRALELDDWLVLDEDLDEQLALKQRLLTERHDQVFAARSGCEEAGAEVLALVQAWLAAHRSEPEIRPVAHPVPEKRPIKPPDGTEPPGFHPLDQAGRLVQEDLCLLLASAGRYRLEAASLCFPSHWRLAEKLGRPVAAIHAPVLHYRDELEARVDTFLDRLRPERPAWRRNLSIHSHDELFRPEPHESPDSFAPDVSGLDQVWLRTERQTLVRLPRTGAVLFTIKTQQCPVSVLAQRREIAWSLAVKLRALEPELRATGETIPFPPWLIDWLLAC
jgi:dimethylamine monooxygenase subunit A